MNGGNSNVKAILNLKRFVIGTVMLCIISCLFAVTVSAVDLSGYTYSEPGIAINTPKPFSLREILEFKEYGGFDTAKDIEIDENGKIYIADTGNNRILIFNSDYTLYKEIKDFIIDGEKDGFNSPSGICVKNSRLYIADTMNERVVVFNEKGEFLFVVAAPESDTLREAFLYHPSKVAVNETGYIYTVGEGMIEGVAEFDTTGKFVRFSACNEATPDLLKYFWTRTFASDKQKEISALFLSEEFNSLAIDDEGYFMTVSTTAGIKRFNTKGNDITKTTGEFLLVGDYKTNDTQSVDNLQDKEGDGVSKFIDIAVDSKGIYSVADEVYQRIFTYDVEGNLLWAFGEQGNLNGSFRHISAISYDKAGNLYVLDSELNRVNVFTLTDFGKQVQIGSQLRFDGKNYEAAKEWAKVSEYDAAYPLAYFGRGMVKYSDGKYKEAMQEFKLCNNTLYYSKCLVHYRRELIGRYFPYGMATLVLSVLSILLVNFIRKKQGKVRQKPLFYEDSSELCFTRQLKYSKYVLLHPFKAFYDIKHEKKASIASATVILLVLVAVNTMQAASTAYLFNTTEFGSLSLFKEFITVFVIAILFCSANWALTTLMDGEGTFKQIYIMTAYSVTPLIITKILSWGIGHFLSIDEAAFLSVIGLIGVAFTAFLLFCGTIVTHQYTLTKNLFAWILTVAAIAAILFLVMIGVQMIDWVITFIKTFGKEIILSFS